MELQDKVVVITGGSGGIGRAMAQAFLREGAKGVCLADLDETTTKQAALELDPSGERCIGMQCDVICESDIKGLADATKEKFGPIDLFCSNAGAGAGGLLTEAEDAIWQNQWELHVMSHLYAARAVLPDMINRGSGYLLNTASAAGLLSQIGSAPYAVTKHAAIGFAEWLSITYGAKGIKVSVLCPQAVRTAMTAGGTGAAGVDGMLEPEQLADTVIATLAEEKFLILPHPEVLTYMRRKTDDYDRWLGGMRRLQDRFTDN